MAPLSSTLLCMKGRWRRRRVAISSLSSPCYAWLLLCFLATALPVLLQGKGALADDTAFCNNQVPCETGFYRYSCYYRITEECGDVCTDPEGCSAGSQIGCDPQECVGEGQCGMMDMTDDDDDDDDDDGTGDPPCTGSECWDPSCCELRDCTQGCELECVYACWDAVDSYAGFCTTCSAISHGSFTSHGGQSSTGCGYECEHEYSAGYGCTSSVADPEILLRHRTLGESHYNNLIRVVDDGDEYRVGFVHKDSDGKYFTEAIMNAQDNSGDCDATLRALKPNALTDVFYNNLGCGVPFKSHQLDDQYAFTPQTEYTADWVTEYCTKFTARAKDSGNRWSETSVAYQCAADVQPQVTIDTSAVGFPFQEFDLNEKARSIVVPSQHLLWSDDSKNENTHMLKMFLAQEGSWWSWLVGEPGLLDGLKVDATDALPLKYNVYCAMNQGIQSEEDWGTLNPQCEQDNMLGVYCGYHKYDFDRADGVHKVDDETKDEGANTLSATFFDECSVAPSDVGTHQLQIMVRNIIPNMEQSVKWVNFDFAISNPLVNFGGGGHKDSHYVSPQIHINFEEWANTVVVTDSTSVNVGQTLVRNRRPWLKFVAERETVPIKHRGCMIDVVNATYTDCHMSSDGSGQWRPAANLATGLHTFKMKVVDWTGEWVTLKKEFRVDARKAVTTILTSVPAAMYDTSLTVEFEADEPSCSFEYRHVQSHDNYGNTTDPTYGSTLDGQWIPIPLSHPSVSQTSGDAYGVGTTSASVTMPSLKLGKHTFEVKAIDSAGNIGNKKMVTFEVSPQLSLTSSNDETLSDNHLKRDFVIRTSDMEEHCEVFGNCVKTLTFTSKYTGGVGPVSLEILDSSLPSWLNATTEEVYDRNYEHTLTLDASKVSSKGLKTFNIQIISMDKVCVSEGPCQANGPVSVGEYTVNNMNVLRPNRFVYTVSLHLHEPPTLKLTPDDFIRKLSGGIEVDITTVSNATLEVQNTGDIALNWNFYFLSADGQAEADECGLDERKEYIGLPPSWISILDSNEQIVTTQVHTVEPGSSQMLRLDFDSKQLRTENYRVSFILQSNDYDLRMDRTYDQDAGFEPTIGNEDSGYRYNGCYGDWKCSSNPDCVSDQTWAYLQDLGGKTCSKMLANSGEVTKRPLATQMSNSEFGWRYVAMEIEGMGANTLIFLPSKLPKTYVAAGTEVMKKVTLVSMIGGCNAYFLYDTASFVPQYDGLLEKEFWAYLSMTKIDRNRETSLIDYEREPFLDLGGSVDSTLLSTMIANGSYPDIHSGTDNILNLWSTWFAQTSGVLSRFNIEERLVKETQILNSNGRLGMSFGIPLELDVNFRFNERYTTLNRTTVDCLLSGQQREKCLQLFSMTFTIENSNDHFFGSWAEPLGMCTGLYGTQACNVEDVSKYGKAKVVNMDVEVEFEPGLCSTELSVIHVNHSASDTFEAGSENFDHSVKAGEEVELTIFTRDHLGNDRFPPDFCRSSLECRAPCAYEPTQEESDLLPEDYRPKNFGSFLKLGEYPMFSSQREPSFVPLASLSDVERMGSSMLQYYCNLNPQAKDSGSVGSGGLGINLGNALEFFTGAPMSGYNVGTADNVYVIIEKLGKSSRRCWDARTLLTWIENEKSWHNEQMRYHPLDKHVLLASEDIDMIMLIANDISLWINLETSEFAQNEMMKVDQISQWVDSTDKGDGTHAIKFPLIKSGRYRVEIGEFTDEFHKFTPESLGIPTISDISAIETNYIRAGGVVGSAFRDTFTFTDESVTSYFFDVKPGDIDLQYFLILGDTHREQLAGDSFCFSMQAHDKFENVVDYEQALSIEVYMLFKELSFKRGSSDIAYKSTATQPSGVSNALGLTYSTCFNLTRAGHYSIWVSEADAFGSSEDGGGGGEDEDEEAQLQNIQVILSRGGDGQASRLNKHVPQDTNILPVAANAENSCIDEIGVSKLTCGDQTIAEYSSLGDELEYTVHAFDIFENPLQSSSSYTFIGRIWGNHSQPVEEEEEGVAGEEQAPWTLEVATSYAYPTNTTACIDSYFGVGTTCPNEFVLKISTEIDSLEWFGAKGNGTYKLTIDISQTAADGSVLDDNRLVNLQHFIHMGQSGLISPQNSEMFSDLPYPLTEPYIDGRALPSYRFKEEYIGIFLMPKDRFGNYLSLPVESNYLSSGVPLSPSIVLMSLYDIVRSGEVLSSLWNFRAQYDKERSEMADAVVFSFFFQPTMNGTYEMNISITDGDEEKPINGNPFQLPVLEIICEEGSQAEMQTGSYCVCSPGWYDQLTADLGDLPDCQKCGIEMSGELDLTQYNERPDQIECTHCPLCADGQTYEYADIGSTTYEACICPNDFVRIPHLTSEEFPVNEFGKDLCHNCPEGAICVNGTDLNGIEAEEGFWRGSPDSDTFIDCDLTIAGGQICAGGEIQGEEFCMEGHTGDLCTQCADGWGRASRGSCIKCIEGQKRKIVDWFQIVGTVLGMGILVTVFVYREIRSMHNKIKEGNFEKSRARTQLLKSMLSYLQVVGIAKEVQVQWNPLLKKYFSTVNSMTSEFAFESQAFTCQLPSTYTQKWQAYMLGPLFASAGLLVVFHLSNLWKSRNKEQELPSKDPETCKEVESGENEGSTVLTNYMTTMLVLGFLAYPSLVRKAVEVFGCRQMLDPKTDRRDPSNYVDRAISLLSVDNSVSCLSTEYTLIRLQAMVAIAVYGIGVPFSVFLAIRARRNQLHEKKNLLMFGFMYSGYKDDFWWWECMSLIRKLFMSLVLVFFSERLYIQLFLGLVVSQLFLLLQLRFKPFTTPLCNIFETFSLFSLWFTLQGTFLYFDGVSIGVNLVITAALATMNFGVCLFFFVTYFYHTLEEKADTLRGPLKKVGIDIDWILKVVKSLSKEVVAVTTTKKALGMLGGRGSTKGKYQEGGSIVVGYADAPQVKQLEHFKKVLEEFDVTQATDEELVLVKEVHAKLEMLLNSDEFLRLGYESTLMDGIEDYIARLRSESGAAFNNPASNFDSLGQDRRAREMQRLAAQANIMDGVSAFLTRYRSDTGRNFENPLADARGEQVLFPPIEGDADGTPPPPPTEEDSILMDNVDKFLTRYRSETGTNFQNPLADATGEAGDGEGLPQQNVGQESLLMDNISNFLTRYRSSTGANFKNPLAEAVVSQAVVQTTPLEHANTAKSTSRLSVIQEDEDVLAKTQKELEELQLRNISVESPADRRPTFELQTPDLDKVEDGGGKSMDYLHSIDNELLRILNWRSEIADSGRYKPLQGDETSKVKHIHRHSIHQGRRRAGAGGNTLINPLHEGIEGEKNVLPLPELTTVTESQSPNTDTDTDTPRTPESSEQAPLLGAGSEDSSTTSVNPVSAARWKRAVEFVANPLQSVSEGEEAAAGGDDKKEVKALPKSLTLNRSGSSKNPAAAASSTSSSSSVQKGKDEDDEEDLISADSRQASDKWQRAVSKVNPLLQKESKSIFALPKSLTLKKDKKSKKKGKK